MTMSLQTIFSILLFIGWLFYGFISETIAPQDTQNKGDVLSPYMPTWQNEGDGSSPMDAQNEGDEWFSLLPSVHNLINECYMTNQMSTFWLTIQVVLGATQKRIRNNPIFWSFIRFAFHAIMIASYSGKLLYHRIYSEFSLWIFYWISYILPMAKLFAYIGINTMCYIMLMLSSLHDKRLRQRQCQRKRILGICRRRMVLSAYMISWEWMGYLKKLGKAPNLYMDRFHHLGINAVFLLTLLCGNSVAVYHVRGVSALYFGQTSFDLVSSASRQTYFACQSFGKPDTNFSVKVSGINEFDDILTPNCCDINCHDDTENSIMASCFPAEVTSITPQVQRVLETVLAHEVTPRDGIADTVFSFLSEPTEFGTDNCATHHICNNLALFIGEIRKVTNIGVKGVGGVAEAVGMGTIRFWIKDENGESEEITLHNVIYLPDCPKNLISITRWSEDRDDNCGIFSRGKYSIFLWNDDRSKKVIYHPPDCPIPLMSVNEGEIDRCNAFLAGTPFKGDICPYIDTLTGKDTLTEVAQQTTEEGLYLPVGSIVRWSDKNKMKLCSITKTSEVNENNEATTKIRVMNSDTEVVVPSSSITSINDPEPSDVLQCPDTIDAASVTEVMSREKIKELWETPDSDFTKDERLFYYWHKRLRHAPKKYIRRLAKRGLLPKQLEKVKRMPLCAACAFADASKRNWRGRGTPKSIRKDTDKVGSNTSCDHLISHEPGIIPQVTGRLTYERYVGAILFTDNFSNYTYTHLIKSMSTEETLKGKIAYERVAKQYGVKIKAYRADNLRFNDKDFTDHCDKADQEYTYCGVGAHHQNGIAESKNKTISYGARKILLHARRKWPKVIKASLWPYALSADTKRDNELSLNELGKSPLEIFADTEAEIHCEDFHTWGCPVFILAEENQSGLTGTPKWEPRARAGVYLGHSPTHAGNVALVLNLKTGHVSPQYHMVFDDDFTTVEYIESGKEPPNWCKLVQDSSERVTDEQYDIARTWYAGENVNNSHKIHDNTLIKEEDTGNLREQVETQ